MAPVLVLYNHPLLPADHPDAESEHTIVAIAKQLGDILTQGGLHVSLLGLKRDPSELWQELQRQKPAAIFNLFEGNLDNTDTESYVAGLLEWSGIPFTGSPYLALSLGRQKHLAKLLLRGHGLPTAEFQVVDKLPVPPCTLAWPVIVKPANQDASVGLDHASVVSCQADLDRRVAYILETYGPPVLVEAYIAGREFNVALTELPELTCLPPAEICFQDRPGCWPILTYAGKWHRDTPEYDLTPGVYPAKIPATLARQLSDLAKRAYRLLGLRDYARVDFRVETATGQPYILEVNPNPEISDTAGFAACLGSAGIKHPDFILQIIQHTLARAQANAAD